MRTLRFIWYVIIMWYKCHCCYYQMEIMKSNTVWKQITHSGVTSAPDLRSFNLDILYKRPFANTPPTNCANWQLCRIITGQRKRARAKDWTSFITLTGAHSCLCRIAFHRECPARWFVFFHSLHSLSLALISLLARCRSKNRLNFREKAGKKI